MPYLLIAALLAAGAVDGGGAAEQINFDETIRRSLAQNLTAQTAVQEVARAEGLLGEARAGALPTLAVQGTYTRLDANRVLGTSVIAGINQEAASAVLSLPLLAPVHWAQWSHGRDNLEVALRSLQDAQRQVAIAAGHAYLAVVAQKRVVEVTQRARNTALAHFNYAHARYAGGVGNRVDEVRAEQEMEADEAQVQAAESNLARTREALAIVTGTDRPLDAVEEPRFPEGPSSAQAEQSAEARRTDLRAAEARADAADHIARDSWLDYLPTLLGVAEPFYQNPPTLTVPQTGWQAQLILSWTLYDGGIRPSQYRERKAGAVEAHEALDQALRQAHSDVRLTYVALERAEDALVAAKKSADHARLALQLVTQSYQAGATSNLEVIDAEKSALDAETNAVVTEDAVRQARLDLLAATGHFPY